MFLFKFSNEITLLHQNFSIMKTIEVVVKAAVIVVFLSNKTLAHNTEISIEEAVKRNLVSANFYSLSGHNGNCIEAVVLNNQAQEIAVFFEPGRIIDSQDNKLQNIILTKKVQLKIPANQKKIAQLFGFCCQLNNASPKHKSIYHLGKMADSSLVFLTQFLSKNNFDNQTQQNAIWCISDNNSLESIPQKFDSCSNALIELCAKLRNTPLPNNCFIYLDVPNRMFSDIKYYYKTKINYTKKRNSKLLIAVYDSLGNTIKVIADNNFSNQKENDFKLCFSVYNWKKGKYYLRILEGNNKEFERVFEI